jgi:dihydrofolate reductase
MELTLIAAFDKNQAIGIDGELPWNLSSDLKHFKKVTTGHSIIMGRKTFDSIGKALPNRKNIVLTRNKEWKVDGVITITNVNEIYQICENEDEVFVIGGAEIYTAFLDTATKMILSYVETEVKDADAFFPQFDMRAWQTIEKSNMIKEEKDDYHYKIITLHKSSE